MSQTPAALLVTLATKKNIDLLVPTCNSRTFFFFLLHVMHYRKALEDFIVFIVFLSLECLNADTKHWITVMQIKKKK